MNIKKTISLSITLFLLPGCDKDNSIDWGQPFQITVGSQTGAPVEGATVEGGIDWGSYQVQTNAGGVATLPGSARGQRATIYKTNFLPALVTSVYPGRYTLNETSKKLNLIGGVEGKAVRFRQNELVTLDYGGTYHLYSYNDQSVSETFRCVLHDSANAVRETQLIGDTLWLTTHDSGVFVFSIQNPMSPAFLFRLTVPGYLSAFAVKDSILVLGDPFEPGPLRVIAYRPTGEWRELSRVQNYFVRKMTRIGNAIILLGNSESLPTVFDISNPGSPALLYNGLEWGYQTGFFYNHLTILTPRYGSGGSIIYLQYKVLDLSNPFNPNPMNPITADSWITGLASDSVAYGNCYVRNLTINILSGGLFTSFQTVASVSENTIEGVGGTFPPYYLIGGRLWKLVGRQ